MRYRPGVLRPHGAAYLPTIVPRLAHDLPQLLRARTAGGLFTVGQQEQKQERASKTSTTTADGGRDAAKIRDDGGDDREYGIGGAGLLGPNHFGPRIALVAQLISGVIDNDDNEKVSHHQEAAIMGEVLVPSKQRLANAKASAMTPPSSGPTSSSSSRANSPFKPWLVERAQMEARRQDAQPRLERSSSFLEAGPSTALYSPPSQPNAASEHAQAVYWSNPSSSATASPQNDAPIQRQRIDAVVDQHQHQQEQDAIQDRALEATRIAAMSLGFTGRTTSAEGVAPEASIMIRNASADGPPASTSLRTATSSPWPGAALMGDASSRQSRAASSRNSQSPSHSGSSTPSSRLFPHSHKKPQVLETHHLQLNTHAPSGRRMINQYIM